MISKIILTNIKSHLSTEIDLAPGLNVIAGESDEGKSNIFRAVTWALFNKPLGWNPKPWPSLKPKGKQSIVEVHFTDGNVVKRIRTFSGQNSYELNGEQLQGLHGKVPDQVENIVNMNYTNIQHQKDMFFLLDDTPGYVAKEINQVADLSRMDVALKHAESEVKRVKGELVVKGKQLTATNDQLHELDWVALVIPAFDSLANRELIFQAEREQLSKNAGLLRGYNLAKEDLNKCAPDDLFIDYKGLQNDMGIIQKARKKLERVRGELATANYTRKALQAMMPDPDGAVTVLKSFQKRAGQYESDLLKVHKTREAVQNYRKLTKKLERALPVECNQKLLRIMQQLEDISRRRVQLAGVKSLVNDYQDTLIEIEECKAKIHSATDALDTLRGQIIVCPVCRRAL